MTAENFKRISVDPFYCITFDPSEFGNHKPMLTKKEWIDLQKITVDGVGFEKWAELLLDVMENGQ